MKKLLLTAASLGLATAMWGTDLNPEVYTDFTPELYKFYEGNGQFKDIFRTDVSHAAPNLGNASWISANTNQGENYFNDENLSAGNLLMGAWLYNNNGREAFKEQATLYDFGGMLKNVMVWNGKGSTLNEAIAEKCGVANPNLPEMSVSVPMNFTLFWLFNNPAMQEALPDGSRAHIRVEFNAYQEGMPATVIFNDLRYQNDGGTALGKQQNITVDQFAVDGEWNPYRYMVYEFEVPYVTNDDGKILSGFFRMANGGGFQDWAILIRSVEIYGVEEEQLAEGEVKITWNDYTPGNVEIDDVTDFTPTHYKFYEGHENFQDIFRTDVTHAAPNLGNASWISANTNMGENYFNDENLERGNLLMGAWLYNNNARESFKNHASLYDFGGELKSVLVWNGKGSTLNEAIAEKCDVDNPELPEMTVSVPMNFTLFWLFNNPAMQETLPEGSRAHIRIEFNAYQEGMPATVLFNDLRYQNDGGTALGKQQNVTIDQFAVDGEWNPYRYMVYEFEVPYVTNDDGKVLSGFFRMANGGGFQDWAILIRSIEIFGVVTEQLADNEVKITWNDYTPDSSKIEDVITDLTPADSEGAVLYNMQGIRVAEPAPGLYIRRIGNKAEKVLVK